MKVDDRLDSTANVRLYGGPVVLVNGKVADGNPEKEWWAMTTTSIHDHYRIITTPYGAPLESFRSHEELMDIAEGMCLSKLPLEEHQR